MSGEALIAIRDLRRTYRMGDAVVHALDGVDLDIERGEFVAVVGPSGSGKSSLMYLLGCLDTPTGGSYRLGGREISALGDRALSGVRGREIGYVFQQFFLLPDLDVTDNIGLPLTYQGLPRSRRREVAAGLATRMGLRERIGHRPAELSGGQIQRVAVARALAGRPSLILADEPTGNLDTHTGEEILALLEELHRAGHTVVLVTHEEAVARRAGRIVTLVDGRITSDEHLAEAPAEGPVAAATADTAGTGSGLGLLDLVRMSLREGLLAHKLRSLLTMLGIIFGIAAVILMTAITEGGKQAQLDQLAQIGLRNIFIRDAELQGAALLRARRRNPRGLSPSDLDRLREHLDGVEAAAAWRTVPAEIRHGNRVVEEAPALGVLGDFQRVANYRVAHGRFLDETDQERFARACVLGPSVATELGLGTGPLGAVVLVGDLPCTVVGVMEHKPFSESEIQGVAITDRNRDVYLPYRTLEAFFPRDAMAGELDLLALSMREVEGLLESSRLARHIVARRHRDAEDFRVSVPLEKLRQARSTEDVFNLVIIVIAGISLVVAGIGIMNIMLANVTERTREIGIRRAVGASRRHVMAQFLTEALVIAGSGGLIGIASGVGAGLAVRFTVGFPVAFDPLIVLVAALVSMAVGIVFGIYPAWLAANQDPVTALRN